MMNQRVSADVRRKGGLPLPDDRGTALAEFALILPLLLVLVIGIFGFGRLRNIHHVIISAANEGARRVVLWDGGSGVASWDAIFLTIRNRLGSAEWRSLTLERTATTACPTTVAGTSRDPGADPLTVAGCGGDAATDAGARALGLASYPRQVLGLVLSRGAVVSVAARSDLTRSDE